ncbi:MAG: polysaccharide biosynthesis protein [Kouleothrix sp.]|nr:polysaccharide biosynthesis protein [Kouleothrix sp.]
MTNSMIDHLLKLRNRHFISLDILVFLTTPAIALVLRTDRLAPDLDVRASLLVATVAFLIVKLMIYYLLGMYRLFWRYASIDELAQMTLVGIVALVTQMLVFFALLRPLGWVSLDFPRSLPLLDGLLTFLAVGGVRYSVRLAERLCQIRYDHGNAKRVLVVGAGQAGVTIVKELRNNPALGLNPVGFVDDSHDKLHSKIQSISVLGSRQDIPKLAVQYNIGTAIIAMPTAPGKVIREVVGICEQAGLTTKIIPAVHELLDGRASVRQLRDVQIEDLLRRKVIWTDTSAVSALISGRRVLVTGAGGSIGSELCRQVLRCGPAELVLLGHGENSIFSIHGELLRLIAADKSATRPAVKLHAAIADIRMPERLEAVFEQFQPEIVLHAAAHKHVPLMELNPVEAITNNVMGTRNLLDVALANGVQYFVMISTDKAVNPTSIMGASKRVAELLVHQAAAISGRPYVAVRFGNVLGSRGSVVLTFKQQIAAGGPVTVTHPDMRRYFMTIPEAVQLTLQAATLGKGGEVFTLDMGEPIKIVDLARDMIELSGLEVGRDIDIVFTGMRPGEKLYEELFVAGEEFERTVHEKIFIACNASTFVPMYLNESIAALDLAAQSNKADRIMYALKSLVPQLRPALVPDSQEPVANELLKMRMVGAAARKP